MAADPQTPYERTKIYEEYFEDFIDRDIPRDEAIEKARKYAKIALGNNDQAYVNLFYAVRLDFEKSAGWKEKAFSLMNEAAKSESRVEFLFSYFATISMTLANTKAQNDITISISYDVLGTYPTSFQANVVVAIIKRRNKDYVAALDYIDNAIRVRPKSSWAIVHKAYILVYLGEIDIAFKAFELAYSYARDNSVIKNRMNGIKNALKIHFSGNELATWVKKFENVFLDTTKDLRIKQYKEYFEDFIDRDISEEEGQRKVKEYQQIAEKNGDISFQQFFVAVEADVKGRPGWLKSALGILEGLYTTFPDVELFGSYYCAVLMTARQHDKVKQISNEVLKKFPDSFQTLTALGISHRYQGSSELSESILLDALQKRPNSPWALGHYAISLTHNRKYKDALETCKKAYKYAKSKHTLEQNINSILTRIKTIDSLEAHEYWKKQFAQVGKENPNQMTQPKTQSTIDASKSGGKKIKVPLSTGFRVTNAPKKGTIFPLPPPSNGPENLYKTLNDTIDQEDMLDFEQDVNVLGSVIASRSLQPPMSIGLFGDWGSGKTFFMAQLEKRIDNCAYVAQEQEKKELSSSYHANIVHVHFNAWHYIDGNLWASLASTIFDRLAEYARNDDSKKVDPKKLRKLLEQVKDHDERIAETEKIEEHLKKGINKLNQDESKILDKFYNSEINELIDSDLKRKITEQFTPIATSLLNMKPADFSSSLKFLRSFGTAIESYLFIFYKYILLKPANLLLLILFIFIPFAIKSMSNWLLTFPELPQVINQIITPITEFFTTAWKSISLSAVFAILYSFREISGKIGGFFKEINESIEESQKNNIEQIRLERETINELIQNEKQKKWDLEREINDIMTGNYLKQFLEDRDKTDQYKKHLGVVSQVRKDLEKLSKLLKSNQSKSIDDSLNEDLPRIDRIILYIDDLDRCEEDNVIEVLQAVHLLLAFDLFVVIVAVDPSWVYHALKTKYNALQHEKDWEIGEGREPTPRDYLEKIFQIPFTIPRMNEDGFKDLVDNIAEKMTGSTVSMDEKILSSEVSTDER